VRDKGEKSREERVSRLKQGWNRLFLFHCGGYAFLAGGRRSQEYSKGQRVLRCTMRRTGKMKKRRTHKKRGKNVRNQKKDCLQVIRPHLHGAFKKDGGHRRRQGEENLIAAHRKKA